MTPAERFLADSELQDQLRIILKARSISKIEPRGLWIEWRTSDDFLNGHATWYLVDQTVHWAMLVAPQSGTLTRLVSELPSFLRENGFTRVTAPGLPLAWQWLEAVGFEPVTNHPWVTAEWLKAIGCDGLPDTETDLYAAELYPPISRLEQYAQWKQGKGYEPPFHQSIAKRRELVA